MVEIEECSLLYLKLLTPKESATVLFDDAEINLRLLEAKLRPEIGHLGAGALLVEKILQRSCEKMRALNEKIREEMVV